MSADGRDHRKLTGKDVEAADPAWSPDGRTIVFVVNGDLSLMTADGREQWRLTRGLAEDGFPGWLPERR